MLRNVGLRKSVEQPVLDLNFAASQIGSNAAPDSRIDFSRGSNAWFVDSDGLVKKSPHNLVLYSEDFSDSSYQKSEVTATDNAISSPFGDLTGALIAETSATANHNLNYFFTVNPDETFTVSYFVKKAGRDVLSLQNYGPGSISGGQYANFDYTFSTNSFGTAGTGGNTTLVARSATDFGNGWVRIQISLTFSGGTSGNGSWRIYANNGSATSYAGDTTKGFYLFGAQISQHTTLPVDNPYIKTTGSAVYAARLDHDPATNTPKGLLIEEARTNLVTDSESHTYLDADINVTQSGSAGLAPDGTNTAIAFMETAATGDHVSRKGGITIADNQNLIFSCFVKANGRTKGAIEIFDAGGGFAIFDLAAGTIGAGNVYGSATNGSSSIEDYGNGWFRVSLGLTTISGDTSATVQIRLYGDDPITNSYAGDATKGFFIWGMQLEQGNFPTSYIKTTGSAATRNADVAVMGPTTGSTELVTNGTYDTDTSGWSNSRATLSVVSGKLRVTSTGGNYPMAFQEITTVIGRRYRITADVTFGTTAGAVVQVNSETGQSFTTSGGVLTSSGSVSVDFTANITNTNIILHGNTGTSAGEYQEFDNVSVRELYPFELYNPSEGTVVCEWERFGTGSFDRVWELSDNRGGSINQNLMGVLTLNNNTIYYIQFQGGSQNLDFQTIGVEQGDKNITAYAYQHNNFHISSSTDGVLGTSFEDTSCPVPAVDTFGIGNPRPFNSNYANSHIKRLTYFPYRLANDVCDSKVTS